MQGDRRLAGARTAADQRRARRGCADGAVLLMLDGGHDVPHHGGRAPGQRGQQRAVADHPHALGHRAGLQQVVLDRDDGRPAAADHPATHDAHPGLRRGLVERRRGRRAPVHHQRLEPLVPQTEPADVPGDAAVEVEPAEDQAVVLAVQCTESASRLEDHHVPLVQATLVAHRGPGMAVGADRGRVRLDGLQPGVHAIDVPLLPREFKADVGRCFSQPKAPEVTAGRAAGRMFSRGGQ